VAGAACAPASWTVRKPAPTGLTPAGLVIGHQHPIIITDLAEDPRVPRYAPALALGVRLPVRQPVGATVARRM